jgi:DNA topoisomerase-3
VVWKQKAGKSLPVAVVKELMESLRQSIERGDDPPSGHTAKQVKGFKSRAGRSFNAKLKLTRTDDGKWRVDFDEDWAS